MSVSAFRHFFHTALKLPGNIGFDSIIPFNLCESKAVTFRMSQPPSRSSVRANRGRPATRIDEDPSIEPLLPAHRDARNRTRSSARQRQDMHRREVRMCSNLTILNP
jgi:hypothetical protein